MPAAFANFPSNCENRAVQSDRLSLKVVRDMFWYSNTLETLYSMILNNMKF